MSQNRLTAFTYRPGTMDDAEAITQLINTCAIERTGKAQTQVEQMRATMQMPGINLETDSSLAVDDQGQVVGFAAIQDTAPHTMIFALADIMPQHRGMGVGTALAQWAEERAQRAVAKAPVAERVTLVQKRVSTDQAAQELLLSQGYQLVRHNFRMTIKMDAAPPQPTQLDGILIRPFVRDRESHSLIHALQEAFRDNWGYVERPFEIEYQRWMHMLDHDPAGDPSPFWFVVMDEEKIAGFALCRPQTNEDPEMAWVRVVGVRPAWRRRGIALALLRHSFAALYRRGKRSAGLEVDSQNATGATRLYEKAGMQVSRRYDFFEKELRPAAKPDAPNRRTD